MNDKRFKECKRRFIIEIDDTTVEPFSNKDLESIAEKFQSILDNDFDVTVVNIIVEKYSNYKNEWQEDKTPS